MIPISYGFGLGKRAWCFTQICTGTDKVKNLSLITLSVHSLLNDLKLSFSRGGARLQCQELASSEPETNIDFPVIRISQSCFGSPWSVSSNNHPLPFPKHTSRSNFVRRRARASQTD